jgi:hypothetical protein
MAGPPRWLAIRELLEGQPSLTSAFGSGRFSFMLHRAWKSHRGRHPTSRRTSHTAGVPHACTVHLAEPAAPNAGIAPQLAIEPHWPGVGEPGRWTVVP